MGSLSVAPGDNLEVLDAPALRDEHLLVEDLHELHQVVHPAVVHEVRRLEAFELFGGFTGDDITARALALAWECTLPRELAIHVLVCATSGRLWSPWWYHH